MTARAPILAACRPCGHVWLVAWLPMEMTLAAKTMSARCPACGEAKRIGLANEATAALWAEGKRGEPFFIDPADGEKRS